MTTLVTGAGGFVGSHILTRIAGAVPLTRQYCDLTKPLPPLPKTDTVIHCAAELDDVSRMYAVNVDGTARLIDWAQRAGVRNFVHVSTGGTRAGGPYAETKREAEELVLQCGLDVRVARLFFVYGPGQRLPRLIPRLIERIRNGEPVIVDERGGPMLSLTYIDDAVDGILDIRARLYDVGGPPLLMRELAGCIGRVVGREPRFETREIPAADFVAITPKGFVAKTDVDDGIRATISRR
jgi:nucleoside-diphosphate-sugar epimerase